mgnify:CR=1 FL=1
MAALAALFALATFPLWALRPAPDGFDKDKLAEIPRRMQELVAKGTIAGAVTLASCRGEAVSLTAVGYADLFERKPMRPDSLFWIASMTKPMTAAAILMLQDEGKLRVDDPVEKFLPEFKDQWMIQEKTAHTLLLSRPPRPITLKDLLTHTSGLGDLPAPRPDCSLAELVMAYARQPLNFPPGSRWQYSNAGINTLGRIVEVVSGLKYADFMQKRLFQPLGMKDTTFWPTAAQARRLATSYQPRKDGSGLEPTPIYFLKGGLSDRSRTAYPAGGLFSTAADVHRFYAMALNQGMVKGKRLLSREALAQMTSTQTGDIKTGFTEGMSFGLGFAVVKEPQGVTALLAPGTFGHGGAYGTQSWADPQKNLILILMIQRAKLPNADASEIRQAFQEAAINSLTPSR